MALPPGISQRDFDRALEQFRNVVGGDWVFSSDEDIALYRDAYSIYWGEEEERVASAAVAPNSAEEVQAVMRIANEFRVPMYPISTGRNLAYGGSAPVYSGSVVLDLKRMNRESASITPSWTPPDRDLPLQTNWGIGYLLAVGCCCAVPCAPSAGFSASGPRAMISCSSSGYDDRAIAVCRVIMRRK
jgi:hypothetical protein